MKLNTLFSHAFLPAITAVLAATLIASPVSAADEIEVIDLDGITEVDFSISGASVALVGSERSDLELVLEKPLTGFDPSRASKSISRDGSTLVIEIEYKKTSGVFGWFSEGSKGYKSATLTLPNSLPAAIHTAGGNLSAEDMNAPIKLRTAGGSIRIENVNGDTDARTSGGSIRVESVTGLVTLRTAGGSINVEGEVAGLDARTSGGSIKVHLNTAPQKPVTLKTSGGSVSAVLEQGTQAPASLSTSGGSVKIELPRDQGFTLEAKSNGGNVSFRHGGAFEGTMNKRSIEGRVNGDGPLVQLSTSGGGVSISEI
ncbi:DUF4097 family beta strand repeat-containing protein [Pelagicoccus albus]|uniref:DUF4097 family beta strand repeat protein n=1 Tax=Pelagicoccus albus TaxID=415222 RepID=A0A7X1B6K0_9BACT|nr:DUF4097 family beta strand repeat-containing protein [Pelagicoccus albus]MBC2606552.1 DUF4097 family beta strand repeat protein [Pelagicoccus albus]